MQQLDRSDHLILVSTNRLTVAGAASSTAPGYLRLSTTREDLATGLISIVGRSAPATQGLLSYSLARWCRGVNHGTVYPFGPGSSAHLHAVGEGTVDGQAAIQLTGTDTTPSPPKAPCLLDGSGPQQQGGSPKPAPGFVRQHWQVDVCINRSTYLPVRVETDRSGEISQVDLQWLPRTKAHLSRFHLLCPNAANGFCTWFDKSQ